MLLASRARARPAAGCGRVAGGRIASCASCAFFTFGRTGAARPGRTRCRRDRALGAGRAERRLGQRRRVGAHVGDEAVLVQALGTRIVGLRREAELAAGLLLEGRGHERRARPAAVRLASTLLDGERRRERVGERARAVLVERDDAVVLELPVGVEVAALGDPPAVERVAADAVNGSGSNVPRGPSTARRRRPCARARARRPGASPRTARGRPRGRCMTFFHSTGRDLVAVQPVEDAPGLLRVDEPHVDLRACRSSARSIASRVISWKTMRWTGTLGLSTSSRCQAIASPSRSSSVASRARRRPSAALAARRPASSCPASTT